MVSEAIAHEMQWVSVLSTRPSLEAAINEVAEQAQAALDGPADLGLVFISSMFASEYPRLLPLLREKLSVRVLVGCGGEGVIGCQGDRPREVEDEPAISLCLARLPEVEIHPFWIGEEEIPDLDSSPQAWIDCVGVDPQTKPQFILLADPSTAGINDLLQGLDFAYPGAVKIGGLTSGGSSRGNGLFCNDQYYEEGTIGVALSGQIVLKAIVAQGCRAIGPVFRVAEGERNIILQIREDGAASDDGTLSPLEALQTLLKALSESDRELAQHSLFIGLAHSEFQLKLGQGDFLIRNLLGIDPRMGAIAVGDRVRVGQRVQFHLRDRYASAEDLEVLLQRYGLEAGLEAEAGGVKARPCGALLFSCLGRGEGLYEEPDFDSRLFQRFLGRLPLAGFFCAGEIGPIGGSTYMHGYTSVFGIACQPEG